MATYLMFGNYSAESVGKISKDRTAKAAELIKGCGGEINAMYALLGNYDLVFVTDFAKLEDAMKASLSLTRSTGISFSTAPALPVEKFDELAAKL